MKKKEKPCCVGIQFTVRKNNKTSILKNYLDLTIIFRSHDILRGWPLNILGFRVFQTEVCKDLNLLLGDICSISVSAHLYLESIPTNFKLRKRNITYYDPEGYFIINLENNQISVQLFSNNDTLIYKWENSLIIGKF